MQPSSLLERILRLIKFLIPRRLFSFLQPAYHYTLSTLGALIYRFPSRHIIVIGVTGTKGKTSTTELVNTVFEKAGHTTALCSTLRFKVGGESTRNMYKMTLPGRFFLQKFLRRAVTAGCTHAIIELTSESVKQYRHKFIDLDALIFTNITPEHIESHGSFENYLNAKLELAHALAVSKKKRTVMVANADDPHGKDFLAVNAKVKVPFSITEVRPYALKKEGLLFTWEGQAFTSPLSGMFNLMNILGALSLSKAFGIGNEAMKRAIEAFDGIPGRMEKIDEGQDFTVIVDYAHTKESLEKVYETFEGHRKICVLGATGGGRDKWKRPEMGAVAGMHCDEIILTNEDPYDENPLDIINDVKEGAGERAEIIIDRGAAIREAIRRATIGDAIIITGKGTDPYICGPKGQKTPWSDQETARGALRARLSGTLGHGTK